MRLYFTGHSPKSVTAMANLQIIRDKHLPVRHKIEFVDVLEEPLWMIRDNIPTTPILVRIRPLPERRVLGDLSDWRQVLATFEIVARGAA